MQTWNQLKEQICQWSKLQITDDQFYTYLSSNEFESSAVVEIYKRQHDGGEWTHAIYHRM